MSKHICGAIYILMVFLTAILILVVSGCGTMHTYRTQARAAGAQAYDEGLDAAVAIVCNDTSVGSIKRRFGVSKSAMQSWIEFCYGDQATIQVPDGAYIAPPPPYKPLYENE